MRNNQISSVLFNLIIFITIQFLIIDNCFSQRLRREWFVAPVFSGIVHFENDKKSLLHSLPMPALELGFGLKYQIKKSKLQCQLSLGTLAMNAFYNLDTPKEQKLFSGNQENISSKLSDFSLSYAQFFSKISIGYERNIFILNREIQIGTDVNLFNFLFDIIQHNANVSYYVNDSTANIEQSSIKMYDTTRNEIHVNADIYFKTKLSESKKGIWHIGLKYNQGFGKRMVGNYRFSNLGEEYSYSGKLYQRLSYLALTFTYSPYTKKEKRETKSKGD